MKFIWLGMLSCSMTWGLFGHRNPAEPKVNLITQDRSTSSRNHLDSTLAKAIVGKLQNREVFDIIHKTIETYAVNSTCTKLAYSSLVHSCQKLEHDTSRGIDTLLDQVKSTFAARLAVCELAEVGLDVVPPSCMFLMADMDKHRHPSDTQDQMVTGQLSDCLRGLYSDSRAWTSYTNDRQNAIMICHATRAYVERDAVLEQYRNFAKVADDISEAHWNSTQNVLKAQSQVHNAAQSVATMLQHAQEKYDAQQARIWQDLEQLKEDFVNHHSHMQASAREANLDIVNTRRNAEDLILYQQELLTGQNNAMMQSLELSNRHFRALSDNLIDATETIKVLQAETGQLGSSLGITHAIMTSLHTQINYTSTEANHLSQKVVYLAEAMTAMGSKQMELLQESYLIAHELNGTMRAIRALCNPARLFTWAWSKIRQTIWPCLAILTSCALTTMALWWLVLYGIRYFITPPIRRFHEIWQELDRQGI